MSSNFEFGSCPVLILLGEIATASPAAEEGAEDEKEEGDSTYTESYYCPYWDQEGGAAYSVNLCVYNCKRG